ncbi:MAG: isoprenylcysteine carboxylmethyltransferase family protein [Bacteroidales bacterium]|nr:isoprenylcysteine carboxylmethyltransferase family protein [Bacteroidales bacterium]
MALLHSFENSGNILFRKRGQIPVILFIFAIPVIYFTDYSHFSEIQVEVLTYISILLSIIGFYIRAVSIGTTPKGTSGRNTKSQVAESLNRTGIYSMVRHPLYLGNYLMWIGIVSFTFNFYFVIIVSLAFWLYYERIMFAEERFLERKFGDDYLEWSKSVPAFIPGFKNYIKSEVPFSIISVLRREYSGFLATVIGFTFIDYLRYYFTTGEFAVLRLSLYCLVIAKMITLILRSLKHHSKLLNEEGRS